jgi:hypothetical protein
MLKILLQLFFVVVSYIVNVSSTLTKNNVKLEMFSGFYNPDTALTAEDFSAAWLVSIDRFMFAEPLINVAPNMAGVSFAVVRHRRSSTPSCRNCVSLLTRDYFDFMVEHLSSTSNQIPFGNKQIFDIANDNIQTTARKLRFMKKRGKQDRDPRLDATLGVLIYSPISFSVTSTPEQDMIRHTFFEATFLSVYRYFPNIVIFVANEVDAEAVYNMSLPAVSVQVVPTPLDARNKTVLLPRRSLETIINGTKVNDPMWSWVKYVYFTEGDQIVHMRGVRHFFDAIDNSAGSFAIVPHRMQTLPLMRTFPEELHKIWPATDVQQHLPEEVEVVTENLGRTRGSCCDKGRNNYAPCGNRWWYACPTWGLANFSTWMRIGDTGFTFPLSTEHKGVCAYSEHKTLCPMPKKCRARAPHVKDFKSRHNVTRETFDLCQEMPIVRHIGHFPVNPDY